MWRSDFDEKAQDLFYMSPGKRIYLDPANGSDGSPGTMNSPKKTPSGAYSLLRDDKNDALMVIPGPSPITVTGSLEIAKNGVSIVGLAPNQHHARTAAIDKAACAIRCVTSGVDSIFNITGNGVRLYNLDTMNTYTHNDNRCDIRVAGRASYFEGCGFRGGNGANQLNHNDGGVAVIMATGTAGAGNGARFKDCHFGNSSNDARSLGASWVLYEGTDVVAGFFNEYIDCIFDTRIETVSAIVGGIILAARFAADRYMLFRNCFFYNFWTNHVDKANYVIYDLAGNTHDIVLMNSAMAGFDAWANTGTYVFTNMADAGTMGGKVSAVAPTTG